MNKPRYQHIIALNEEEEKKTVIIRKEGISLKSIYIKGLEWFLKIRGEK